MKHVSEVHGELGALVALCEDGIRFSGDAKAWTLATGAPKQVESIAWVSVTEMYCIDGEGAAYHSGDGQKWSACGQFPDKRKLEVSFVCAREGTLVVADASGFYRSSDEGATWTWKDLEPRDERWYSPRVAGDSLLLLSPARVLRRSVGRSPWARSLEVA